MLASLLTAALVALAPCDKVESPAAGAAGDSTLWNGVFVLDRSASDDLSHLADQAPRRVRSRLKDRLKPAECLRLSDDGATVAIESERGPLWRVGRDGSVEARGGAGNGSRSFKGTVEAQAIGISGSGERGAMRWELKRSPDGDRLDVAVTMEARRLDHPVAYTLVYRERPIGEGS